MAGLVFPDSLTTREVYRVLKPLSLATARDLAGVLEMSAEQATSGLNRLLESRWVRQDRLGSFIPHGKRSRRWSITPEALEQDGLVGQTMHEEGNRCRLLELLPMVAQFYGILEQIDGLGRFVDFLWPHGLAMDAAARFERGWVAFYWSGPQETAREISKRVDSILEDVEGATEGPVPAWPCLLAWVVSDEWQRELVQRAVPAWMLDGSVSIWCVNDGSRSGVMLPDPELGSGWITQPVRVLDTGGWSWDPRVAASIWSRANGHANFRMLRLAQNFPGINPEMGRLDLGEEAHGKAAERSLRGLDRIGFLDSERNGRDVRYYLDTPGIEALIRLDKATHNDYRNRALSDSWVTRPDRRTHEEGVMGLITDFMAAGLPVAPGWRCEVHMRNWSIEPDGAVLLNRSPYGPVWHLIEYERSARGQVRVGKKMRGHGAQGEEGRPVLVVCYDNRAEANFHAVGETMELQMLTTTIDRLKVHEPLNNWDCWSMYGESVRIG